MELINWEKTGKLIGFYLKWRHLHFLVIHIWQMDSMIQGFFLIIKIIYLFIYLFIYF
jgi:hypothetical protein